MVSFWPFKGESTDAATFEKTLSSLSAKITKASSRNDSLRLQARRLRVGWVLYGGFAYILIFLILTLVTGWDTWGMPAYSIVAGGPPLLYIVRLAIISYYNWRIESSQAQLDDLYKKRDATIEKLKKATKYDSTQQLLDKYGSPKPSPKQKEGKQGTPKGRTAASPEQRVFRQPPPTANIRRDQPAGQIPPKIQVPPQATQQPPPDVGPPSPRGPLSPGEEFAPNAFGDGPTQYLPAAAQSGWYDRIMDALLGDDETQARNRLALICQSCRLVNGQAPPGTRTLEDVGRWRCGACGVWNGSESEAEKALLQLAEHGDLPVPMSPTSPAEVAGRGGEEERDDEDEVDDAVVVSRDGDIGEDDDDTPARSTRRRRGGKSK